MAGKRRGGRERTEMSGKENMTHESWRTIFVEWKEFLEAKIAALMEFFKSQIAALKEVMDERHNLYKERAEAQKTAVDDALVAVKEQTAASFLSSEKAIVKAEEAQKAYNTAHNDLSRKMDEQYKSMVPKSEALLKWETFDSSLEGIKRDSVIMRESLPREISSLRSEFMREISGIRDTQSRSVGNLAGKEKAEEVSRAMNKWIIGLLVLGGLELLASVIAVATLFLKGH